MQCACNDNLWTHSSSLSPPSRFTEIPPKIWQRCPQWYLKVATGKKEKIFCNTEFADVLLLSSSAGLWKNPWNETIWEIILWRKVTLWLGCSHRSLCSLYAEGLWADISSCAKKKKKIADVEENELRCVCRHLCVWLSWGNYETMTKSAIFLESNDEHLS